MGSKSIFLNLSSPEQSVSGIEVQLVTLPGAKGRFTVLYGHAPLISALTEGDIRYVTVDGKEVKRHIRAGFAEVSDNVVSVSAEI